MASSTTDTSTPIRLINPSLQLMQAVHVVGSEYVPTCGILGCLCESHDAGYRYVDMILPKGWTMEDVYIRPETSTRYKRSYLAAEYEAMQIAAGLPKNAPAWAFTPESRRLKGKFCHGRGVNVSTSRSGLTVVTLMVGCNPDGAEVGYWKEEEIFATSNGCDKKTKQFLEERSQDNKDEFFGRRQEDGFLFEEAVRMYEIPRRLQFPWQLSVLISIADKMRTASIEKLCELIKVESRHEQSVLLDQIGIAESVGGDLPHPQIRDLVEKALWIFRGTNLCDVEGKAPMPAGPAPFIEEDVEPAAPNSTLKSVRDRLKRKTPKPSDVVSPTSEGVGNPKSKEGWLPSMGSVPGMFAIGAFMTELIARKP